MLSVELDFFLFHFSALTHSQNVKDVEAVENFLFKTFNEWVKVED